MILSNVILPSTRDSELADAKPLLKDIGDALATMRNIIEKKASDLGAAYTLPEEDIFLPITNLNAIIEEKQ